jgi:two-component sensor histidine kinase
VVGALLDAWKLTRLRADAELVISELVTNAVRHAPGSDSFELEIVQQQGGVRLMLADAAPIRPLVQELSPDKPSGRGMQIVEALAASWGADNHHGGKRVWVDLRAHDSRGD